LRGLAKIDLIKTRVSPANAQSVLAACSCPKEFGLLSLDIDSFDNEVLDSILSAYRPSVLCCEINEVIPPPIAFRVVYSPKHKWEWGVFQGQSIEMCNQVARMHGYRIVELYYNNLIMIRSDDPAGIALSPYEAYQRGYLGKSDRLERFPWNRDFEHLYSMTPDAALNYLNKLFSGRGNFELTINRKQ